MTDQKFTKFPKDRKVVKAIPKGESLVTFEDGTVSKAAVMHFIDDKGQRWTSYIRTTSDRPLAEYYKLLRETVMEYEVYDDLIPYDEYREKMQNSETVTTNRNAQ